MLPEGTPGFAGMTAREKDFEMLDPTYSRLIGFYISCMPARYNYERRKRSFERQVALGERSPVSSIQLQDQ